MSEPQPDWSIVIPCFNGAPFIARTLEQLLAYANDDANQLGHGEIVVVDDGSTDDTAAQVESFDRDVRLVRLPENQGKGEAVRRGMLEATGRYRFFTDADLPYELRSLALMMHYLRDKEFDLCIGTRRIEDMEAHAPRSPLRILTSRLYTFFSSRIVVTGVRDTQCGLKGFRDDVAEYLFSESRTKGFAFDVEILYLAYKNEMDVKRIPVVLATEDYSSVSVLRHGPRMLVDVLKLPYRYYTHQYTMMKRPSLWDRL